MEETGSGAGRDEPGAASAEAGESAAVLSPLASRTLSLAVVDLDKVFEQSGEWQDHLEQRRQMVETMRRTLSSYDRQIRMLRDDYANMPPGTDAASEKLQEIDAAAREFGTTRDGFEQQLAEQHAAALSAMFNKIGALLEVYAKENGIDLVLKKQNVRVSSADPAELGVIVATTEVLYASDEFDVTDVIVKQLNAQWGQDLILSP
jgi:Skp family chaperone for outer membrane proteins